VSKEPLIAVIDDDESFRIALVESLYSLGNDAREFASAEEFLAVEGLCDCVVTDIHMPGMSGFDLKQLKRGMSCSCAQTESDSPFLGQQNPPIIRTGS
jgi:FixJ family two-component response regulator